MKSTIVKILTAALAVAMLTCVAAGCNNKKDEQSSAASDTSAASTVESSEESKTESTESTTESTTESKTETSTEVSTPAANGEILDLSTITADKIGIFSKGADPMGYELGFATINNGTDKGLALVVVTHGEEAGTVDLAVYGRPSDESKTQGEDGSSITTFTITDDAGKSCAVRMVQASDGTTTIEINGLETVFTLSPVEDNETAAATLRMFAPYITAAAGTATTETSGAATTQTSSGDGTVDVTIDGTVIVDGTGDDGTGDEGTGDEGTGDEGTGDEGTGDEGAGDEGAGDEGGDEGAGDEGDEGGDEGAGDEGGDEE